MAFPIDQSFPTWTSGQTPGAGDLNKIQESAKNVWNPPSAAVSRTDVEAITSDLNWHGLYWNKVLWETDSRMVDAIDASHYTDRIHLPEPGEWDLECHIRTQTSSNTGYGQLRLVLISDNNTITELDSDEQLNRWDTSAQAQTLKTHAHFILTATQIANGTALRAEYSQNSGGLNTIRVLSPAYAASPVLRARLVGKGGL